MDSRCEVRRGDLGGFSASSGEAGALPLLFDSSPGSDLLSESYSLSDSFSGRGGNDGRSEARGVAAEVEETRRPVKDREEVLEKGDDVSVRLESFASSKVSCTMGSWKLAWGWHSSRSCQDDMTDCLSGFLCNSGSVQSLTPS